MILLQLRRVRMYVLFFLKYHYIFGHEIKLSEIRKLFACWQKWFYGIALLRTAKLMCGNMGNHTV